MKAWEIAAYPQLLAEIRSVLGAGKLISAAVPGLPRDMLAFTPDTVPAISASLDFFNVMAYDLMNRRDHVTKHHTGAALSLAAVDAYAARGVPPAKMNLGFAFYVKWFRTAPRAGCTAHPIGCPTLPLEDPATGADLGRCGGFAHHDTVPADVAASWARARRDGRYDPELGGHYYYDSQEHRWWTWDTPEAIRRKFPAVVEERGVGGAFAWGLGEDGDKFVHLMALTACMAERETEPAAAAGRFVDEL